jgi:hypothetical protein
MIVNTVPMMSALMVRISNMCDIEYMCDNWILCWCFDDNDTSSVVGTEWGISCNN